MSNVPNGYEKKILIVDDDPTILEVIQDILSLESLSTEKALDGQTAFAKILEDSFQLLVCDIEIPFFNGIELVQRLQSSGISIPVIFLSSNLNEKKKEMASVVKPRAILPKPFDADLLIKVVKDNL